MAKRKADPDKDRFTAYGGGPWDGVIYLPRRRTKDTAFSPPRVTVVGELPDEIPCVGGEYRRQYDPESNQTFYVWSRA
jgi:hypothetical protein